MKMMKEMKKKKTKMKNKYIIIKVYIKRKIIEKT